MLYHNPLLLPIILPHRIEYIDHFTIGNRHGSVQDIGVDYIKHAGRQGALFLANGHVQLAFQNIGNLLMRVTVFRQVTPGFDFYQTQGHVAAVGVKTGEARSKGFGGLVF